MYIWVVLGTIEKQGWVLFHSLNIITVSDNKDLYLIYTNNSVY